MMDAEKEKYLSKIKKLLGLAASSNPHEAALALSRAQAFMKKYDIELSEVMLSKVSFASVAIEVKRPAAWVLHLLNVIEKAFGVESVISTIFDEDKYRSVGAIQFIGIKPNDELAAYSFDVLFRQLKFDRKTFVAQLHKNCKRDTKKHRADWYCMGWVAEVNKKVSSLVVPTSQRNLISQWKKQNLTLQEYKARETKEDKRSFDSYLKGKADGAKSSLYAGMGGSERLKIGGGV